MTWPKVLERGCCWNKLSWPGGARTVEHACDEGPPFCRCHAGQQTEVEMFG